MMRQLTQFDAHNDRDDQENLDKVPQHLLGAQSATVVDWVHAKRRRREKRAKRKQNILEGKPEEDKEEGEESSEDSYDSEEEEKKWQEEKCQVKI